MSRKYTSAAASTASSSASSCQLVLPRSPKVQNTTAPSCVSSAKYCSSVLPPVKRLLSATPASTSAPGPRSRRTLDMATMTAVDALPQTKAQRVTM